MNKINVLIADDVEPITRAYKAIISKNENFNIVYIANNGEDEYNKILELKPQVVITDNQMPKLNGIDVIEKIYNSEIQDKPYFVVISGDSDYLFTKKCMNLDVFKVIRKPVTEETLLYCLDELIDIFSCNDNDSNPNNSNKNEKKKGFLRFFKRKED